MSIIEEREKLKNKFHNEWFGKPYTEEQIEYYAADMVIESKITLLSHMLAAMTTEYESDPYRHAFIGLKKYIVEELNKLLKDNKGE